MFPCEFCKIYKNICFEEFLRTASSGNQMYRLIETTFFYKKVIEHGCFEITTMLLYKNVGWRNGWP